MHYQNDPSFHTAPLKVEALFVIVLLGLLSVNLAGEPSSLLLGD